jgi:hypothetical protein
MLLYLAWGILALMAACGLLFWCCVRAGARAEQEFDEAQISAAVEGALIRELSDVRFVGDGK